MKNLSDTIKVAVNADYVKFNSNLNIVLAKTYKDGDYSYNELKKEIEYMLAQSIFNYLARIGDDANNCYEVDNVSVQLLTSWEKTETVTMISNEFIVKAMVTVVAIVDTRYAGLSCLTESLECIIDRIKDNTDNDYEYYSAMNTNIKVVNGIGESTIIGYDDSNKAKVFDDGEMLW